MRILSAVLVVVLLCTVACHSPRTTGNQETAAQPVVEAAPPPVDPADILIPAGSRLMIRTSQPIDSQRHGTGYRFTAALEGALADANGEVVIPAGTMVYGTLVKAKSAGRVAGKSELTLALTDIRLNEQLKPVQTSGVQAVGQGSGKSTAGSVVAGAAIGRLAKGNKTGTRRGAAVGLGAAVLTSGQQINIPAGTLLEFTLATPLLK